MIDKNGKYFMSFTVGNGRFFIDNKEVPMWKYLEEKAKYEGKTHIIIDCQEEHDSRG